MNFQTLFRPVAMAGALALAASPVMAAAAPKAAPAAKAPPSKETYEHAMGYLNVLIAALQSDKVEDPVKGTLVGCLYNNSLGKIATSMDNVIAQNADKVHRDKPNEVLEAMAVVCGYKPQPKAGAKAPAKGR